MGKFDSILDKIQKAASDRDAGQAKQKCPLKKKPGLYIVVARGDTGEPVKGIEIDVSKPTQQKVTTDGSGEAKIDPAKKGKHGIKVRLSDAQAKEFQAPSVQQASTSKGKTSILVFILEPLPKLVVEVLDRDGNKPLSGVKVRAGSIPEMSTSGGKADFGGIPAGKYRLTVTPPNPLETKTEVMFMGASHKIFEPGHAVSWDLDLPYGQSRSFKVLLSKVRSIEFILAEEGTDKPIPGAKLHAKLPGGGKLIVETNQVGNARVTYGMDGKVEIERIELPHPGHLVEMKTL